MLKLLGTVCILGGGTVVWVQQVSASRKELAVLRQLLLVLDQMEGEVHLMRTPLPRLLRKLSGGRMSCVAEWLTAMASGLERGESLSICAAGPIVQLPLDPEGRDALSELVEKLSGSEEQVCRGILLVRNQLADLLETKRLCQKEMEKRTAALCFSATAFLIIILI